jgi:hypothetical protein
MHWGPCPNCGYDSAIDTIFTNISGTIISPDDGVSFRNATNAVARLSGTFTVAQGAIGALKKGSVTDEYIGPIQTRLYELGQRVKEAEEKLAVLYERTAEERNNFIKETDKTNYDFQIYMRDSMEKLLLNQQLTNIKLDELLKRTPTEEEYDILAKNILNKQEEIADRLGKQIDNYVKEIEKTQGKEKANMFRRIAEGISKVSTIAQAILWLKDIFPFLQSNFQILLSLLGI